MSKRRVVSVGGFVIILWVIFGFVRGPGENTSSFISHGYLKVPNRALPGVKNVAREMQMRIQHQKQACNRLGRLKKYRKVRRNTHGFEPIIIDAERYNLSYCNVGKTGGTFIKRIFAVLLKGEDNLKSLESVSRLRMHKNMVEYKRTFKTSSRKNAQVITVGRNPFTRLFSAYVDRVFVPSITPQIRNGSRCRFDVTFEEFLKIVIWNTEHLYFDNHWSPIFYLCRPCDVTSTYIVKQETFKDDMDFVIDSLNLTENQKSAIRTDIKQSRESWTITGIVKEMMVSASDQFVKSGCIGWFGGLKRLWTAFQIQGYIDEHVEFPITLFNETHDFSNPAIFLKTVFDVREKYPLSNERKEAQRRRALVDAYRKVSKEVIQDIKRIFKPDFEMFGYHYDAPS